MIAGITGLMTSRNFFFLLFNIVTVIIFSAPLRELLRMSSRSELYSHIVLIPFVSGYFFYQRRKEILSGAEYSYLWGGALILSGIFLFFAGSTYRTNLNQNDYLSLMIFSAVTSWIGGFLLFYGKKAFRSGFFPLLFLFFLVPIPTLLIEKIIRFLQIGSTEVTYILFKLAGVPIYREGFTFHLAGLSIEVAPQCSGIRSSIALFITGIIAGQLFLQTHRNRWILLLSAIPITIFKNGLRIVTLSLLGVYVDPRILGSDLHKRGGIPFFILALAVMAPILFWLIKTERKDKGGSAKGTGSRK